MCILCLQEDASSPSMPHMCDFSKALLVSVAISAASRAAQATFLVWGQSDASQHWPFQLTAGFACCSIRTLGGHRQRVGALAWGSHLLSTGSRDRHILHHDIRAPEDYVHRLSGHRSEVRF